MGRWTRYICGAAHSIGTKESHMGESANALFDPQDFLAKVGLGKTISRYRKDQIVFAQGEVADTIFYIQRGRVKVVVLSDQGKEAVVGILEPGQFFGEGCLKVLDRELIYAGRCM